MLVTFRTFGGKNMTGLRVTPQSVVSIWSPVSHSFGMLP